MMRSTGKNPQIERIRRRLVHIGGRVSRVAISVQAAADAKPGKGHKHTDSGRFAFTIVDTYDGAKLVEMKVPGAEPILFAVKNLKESPTRKQAMEFLSEQLTTLAALYDAVQAALHVGLVEGSRAHAAGDKKGYSERAALVTAMRESERDWCVIVRFAAAMAGEYGLEHPALPKLTRAADAIAGIMAEEAEAARNRKG